MVKQELRSTINAKRFSGIKVSGGVHKTYGLFLKVLIIILLGLPLYIHSLIFAFNKY